MDSLTIPILTVIASVAGTWGVMRAQVADLRAAKEAQEREIGELKDRVTRLEERLDALVDNLKAAVEDLKRVTSKLEDLAVKIAGGGK